MADNYQELSQINPEQERIAKALDFLELIDGTLDTFDMEMDEAIESGKDGNSQGVSIAETKKLLKSVRESYGLNDETSKVVSCVVRERLVKPKDQDGFLPGEDTGVFARLTMSDGKEININIWGGLRKKDDRDGTQTTEVVRKGMSSASMTDAIVSKATYVNINVSNQGQQESELWLNIGPVGSKRLAIDRVSCADSKKRSNEPKRGRPFSVDADTGKYLVGQLRSEKGIKTLLNLSRK